MSADRPEVIIRLADPGDLDAMLDLWWDTQRLHAELDPRYYADLGEEACRESCRGYLRSRLRAPEARFLVADVDGRVVGLLLGEFRLRPPIFAVARQASIELAATASGCRRQGIFRRLLNRFLAIARAEGVDLVTLGVDAANGPALAAYAATGFTSRQAVMIHWLDREEGVT